MAKKIIDTGKLARRIEDTGKTMRRIEPEEFAAALGAEPVGEPHDPGLDPISLAALGSALVSRLRSSGGRPALTDASELCRVPLSSEDLAELEAIGTRIQRETGSKPSPGQVASVIIRAHLDSLKNPARGPVGESALALETGSESVLSLTVVKRLIEEELGPMREVLKKLAVK